MSAKVSFLAIGAVLTGLLLFPAQSRLTLNAQQGPPQLPPPGQMLAATQLDDLVAPIALYPDPVLSQILVAATYPLEVVQLLQWMQRNPGLNGTALAQAAQQQSWDASVQALAAFPDLVKRLNQDITWTTDLGNAFLNQQAEVMDAVQRMRGKAQQLGRLSSTEQQTVITNNEMIEIQPANPEMLYLPEYDPSYIWGPPLFYPYASWFYPHYGSGIYFGWGSGIPIGLYFGGGWGGWGGWGWRVGWGGHNIIVNNNFIHRNNFNSGRGGSLRGTGNWSHDGLHRQGVPYSNPASSARYGGNARQNLQTRATDTQSRQMGERMGNRQVPANRTNTNRSAFGGVREGSAARGHSDHGFSSLGPARSGGGGGARMGGGPSRGGGGGPRGGGGHK